MKLAAKMAWEYRWSWVAMFLLTAASATVLITSSHVAWANDIVTAETGNASLKFDFYLSILATLLVTQTIAVLCLESQTRDLAIIKTCGASARSIRRTLLGEIISVTLAGFVLGVLLALPIIQPYTTWAVELSTNIVGRVFGYNIGSFVSALVALLAAVLIGSYSTLKRVSKQNVVSALQGEATGGKKRRRILSKIIASFAIFGNIVLIGMVFASSTILTFVRTMIEQSAGADAAQGRSSLANAEGGLLIMPPMLFVMGVMIICAAFAPTLYRWILSQSARLLPARAPGWLEVGINQAMYNSRKYYGSITPLVIFILAIVMVFAVIDATLAPLMTMYAQHGVDISNISTETDYQAVVMLIGPALFIAFVGSLANMMMSGRNRIYVNKLTAIIGIQKRSSFWQALAETTSYVYAAAVLGLVTMFAASGLVWIAGNVMTGVQHPYVVSWLAYCLAVLFMLIIMSVPAITSVFRSRHLASKQVLESFGE